MLCALNTSIKRSYSRRFASSDFSLKRQEPNAPEGVWRNAEIAEVDSLLVSMSSSSKAPIIPLRPA